jgi:uncharacterized membrane protein
MAGRLIPHVGALDGLAERGRVDCMIKWISPLFTGLKHLSRPHMFRVMAAPSAASDAPSRGQRMAERVAALVGSWAFLGAQSGFLFLWLVYNTFQFTNHFDPPPYILLNLLLSFQAAFTGPVLLIAANVGAMRDHKQADRIERLTKQNEELAERLLGVEQILEQHVTQSLQTHAMELRELGILMRAVHAAVCTTPVLDGATTPAYHPQGGDGAGPSAALGDAAIKNVNKVASKPVRRR